MSSVPSRLQSVVEPHHAHAQAPRLRPVPLPPLHRRRRHHHHHRRGVVVRRRCGRVSDADRPATPRRGRPRSPDRRRRSLATSAGASSAAPGTVHSRLTASRVQLSRRERKSAGNSWHGAAGSLWLAISDAEIYICFSDRIHGSNPVSSNNTRKPLWFETTKMLIAVLKSRPKFIVLFMIIFRTLLFPVCFCRAEQAPISPIYACILVTPVYEGRF